MPEMDGYTVVEKLRERNSALPVVALTAFAMSDEPAKCIRAGFNAYASKPIDRDMLIAICLKWGRKPHS
jgi:CheY-like chemotaxis protein